MSLDSDQPSVPTSVYLLWDEHKQVIYVGITKRRMHRMSQHSMKEWWTEVRGARFLHYESLRAAQAAEKRLIRELRPRYNVHFNKPKVSDPFEEAVEELASAFAARRAESMNVEGPYKRPAIG